MQKRNRILLCRYAKKRKRTNKRTNKKKSVSLFGAQFRVCAFRNQSKLKSCEVPNRAPAPPTACYPLGVPLRAVQASASLKPLCVDTALDTGPLDTVGKTSVSMETWLETALWKPALSLVTKLVTSVLVTPGFSASSLCAPAPSSWVPARGEGLDFKSDQAESS